ncbi:MAG: hypothetical protein MPK62_05780, partial [Alphaproteobacteria bacterium]|nr:hypothetical protein [Alphaproteobacteria bacterium]
MARARSAYVCQACGGAHPRWLGRCEHCGEWNTLVEDASVPAGTKKTTRSARGVEFISLAGEVAEPCGLRTNGSACESVTGGGPVCGPGRRAGGARQGRCEERVGSRDEREGQYVANGFEIRSRERGMLGGLPTYELSA